MRKVVWTKSELTKLNKKYQNVEYKNGVYQVLSGEGTQYLRKIPVNDTLRFNLIEGKFNKTMIIYDFVKKVLYPQEKYQTLCSIYELQSICNFLEMQGYKLKDLDDNDLYELVRRNVYEKD